MSQTATKADSEDRAPSIERAGKHKWGYNIAQVDDFLDRTHSMYESSTPVLTQEDIQLASFDLEKNGYVISQVDAVLIRLEKAVVDQRTQYTLSTTGRDAWQEDLLALARTLQERAEAAPRQRFSRGTHHQPSYDMKQVDQIVSQAWTRIAGVIGITTSAQPAEGAQEITARRVSNVIFTQRKGRHGYGEASVDAYLNRCVQVLTRIESFERVAGRPVEPFAASAVAAPAASPAAQGADTAAGKGARPADGGQAPASVPDRGTVPMMPISYDGPSAVADDQAQAPQAYAPIPQPTHTPSPVQEAPSQTQDTGWGSAGLASLVSVPSSQDDRADDSVDSGSSSPAGPDAGIPSQDAVHDDGRASVGSDGLDVRPAQAAQPVHTTPDMTGAVDDAASDRHDAGSDDAPSVSSGDTVAHPSQAPAAQQVYSDLPAVPDASSDEGDGTDGVRQQDSGYISSLLSTPVTSTGTFEIPDLTFPASRTTHDAAPGHHDARSADASHRQDGESADTDGHGDGDKSE